MVGSEPSHTQEGKCRLGTIARIIAVSASPRLSSPESDAHIPECFPRVYTLHLWRYCRKSSQAKTISGRSRKGGVYVEPLTSVAGTGSWAKMGPWLLRFRSRVGVGSSLGSCEVRSRSVSLCHSWTWRGWKRGRSMLDPVAGAGTVCLSGRRDGMDGGLGVQSLPANPAPRGFQTWKEVDWESQHLPPGSSSNMLHAIGGRSVLTMAPRTASGATSQPHGLSVCPLARCFCPSCNLYWGRHDTELDRWPELARPPPGPKIRQGMRAGHARAPWDVR